MLILVGVAPVDSLASDLRQQWECSELSAVEVEKEEEREASLRWVISSARTR